MRFEGRRGGGFGGHSRFGGGRRSFGGRDDRDDMPKPVKVGEEYDVEINEVGSRGDGIARIKNFVVFINGVKQGEKAHIKITEVRNRFAVGEKTAAGAGSTEGESTDATEETVAEAESEESSEESEESESEDESKEESEEEMK